VSINAPRKAPSDDVASELRKFALIYGCRLRWPIFPVNPLNKNPLIKDGFKSASTDEATIKSWWTKWPVAMIGIATGDAVGFFVVDLDAGADKKTGEIFELDAITATLESELGVSLPPTWTVATPRGGRHLYFELPKGIAIGNRTGLIRRVDVRSTGGYVIVPPSRAYAD